MDKRTFFGWSLDFVKVEGLLFLNQVHFRCILILKRIFFMSLKKEIVAGNVVHKVGFRQYLWSSDSTVFLDILMISTISCTLYREFSASIALIRSIFIIAGLQVPSFFKSKLPALYLLNQLWMIVVVIALFL